MRRVRGRPLTPTPQPPPNTSRACWVSWRLLFVAAARVYHRTGSTRHCRCALTLRAFVVRWVRTAMVLRLAEEERLRAIDEARANDM